MNASRAALAALVLAATAAPAAAEDGAAGDPHRWALWTSCTVVFALLTAFLVWTHRRTQADVRRLESAEERLSRLEKK
ncbi:MAG: hypothetical protein HMLKMBBP_01720 [Planctomycetes bacterium]|nr:hypothetical protein [Planctomycetota bacterium]